jgi:hypothetical protein
LANRRPEIRIAFLEEGSHKLGMHVRLEMSPHQRQAPRESERT